VQVGQDEVDGGRSAGRLWSCREVVLPHVG
jgi:hypothetical protein